MRISFYFSLYYIYYLSNLKSFHYYTTFFFKFIYSYFCLLISSSYVSILPLKTFGRVYFFLSFTS